MRNFFCLALLAWAAPCRGAIPMENPIWEKIQLPKAVGEPNLHSVCFVDAKRGWIVGDGGLCMRTQDGGITWERQETGSKAILRGVQFVDARNGWICGDSDKGAPNATTFGLLHTIGGFGRPMKPGTLLHTTDGGKIWKTSWIPTNFEIRCLEASASPRILVGTHSGTKRHLDGDFLCSPKGGETESWERDNEGGRCCRSISALRKIEGKRWVAVGAANRGAAGGNPALRTTYPLWDKPTCRALYSEDGGKTWKFSKGSDGKLDSELCAVAVGKNHAVLAVGEEGIILRSQDAGATWETVPSGTTADLASVTWCGSLALAAGKNGTVVLGRDDGKRWEPVPTKQTQELCGLGVAGEYVIAVGKKATVLRAKIAELAIAKKNAPIK